MRKAYVVVYRGVVGPKLQGLQVACQGCTWLAGLLVEISEIGEIIPGIRKIGPQLNSPAIFCNGLISFPLAISIICR